MRPACIALLFLISSPQALGQIVLPGTQPGELVNWPLARPSEPYPTGNDLGCRDCHADYVAGQTYEPFDSWAGSMMANAARDPLFWAAVDIANQDEPGAGEFCIRCHSPAAWLGGRSATPDGSDFIGYPDEPDNDFEGVDCHFCHRMYEGAGPYTENGQYFVDDGTPGNEPPRRGPFTVAFAPHPYQYSSYHESSEFCGACHNLRNPLVNLLDEFGVDTGLKFPEQTTYTEWQQSALPGEGTECQTCHMPDPGLAVAYACNSFNPPRPDPSDNKPLKRHDLAGANVFMMQVLKGEYGAALGREAMYDHSIAQAMDMLQNQAATVEVTTPGVAVEGNYVDVQVRVTNNTGHKLPTGYPEGRRMWLYIRATDALGAPFYESGVYDDGAATLVQDPQLTVYETLHGVEGEGAGFHLVRNNRIFFDNRLPPRGFVPNVETMPVGVTYPDLGGGVLAHYSDVEYSIPVPMGVQGPINVTATLRYQTASRDYVEFLRDENSSGPDPHDRNYPVADNRGQKMYDLWSAYGKSAPIDMTADSGSSPVISAPANVAVLNATPGHNQVELQWVLPAAGETGVKIFREKWLDYPEFGSAGGALAAPSYPLDIDAAVADGWVEVYDGLGSSFTDTAFNDAGRTLAFYAAYCYDAQGTSALTASSAQSVSSSYRLGDVGEVGLPGVYDGEIDGIKDLPVFSLAYGATPADPGWNPECDFGPTNNGGGTGVPQPDDIVNFEDLLLFAIQFGVPAAAKPVEPFVLAKDFARLALEAEAPTEAGVRRVRVSLPGVVGSFRALHLELPRTMGQRLLAVEAPSTRLDGMLTAFHGIVRGDERVDVDIAALGAPLTLAADGWVATLLFEDDVALVDFGALKAEFVDGDGRRLRALVEYETLDRPVLASRLALSPAIPNPFNPRTTLELSLARAGNVDVVIYDLAGRRVRTLLSGLQPAGTQTLVWSGQDDSGRSVSSGIYLCRATAHGTSTVRRMVLLK